MLFFLDLLAVFLFALILSTLLAVREKKAAFISLFLIACANIVITTEFLSLLQGINRNNLLISHLILLGIAGIAWWAKGRPSLTAVFMLPASFKRGELGSFIHTHLTMFGLAVAVAFGYLITAILAVALPPNNVDSMTYHLSRIGYWMQQESLLPWSTSNPRQVTSPINAEILAMWTMIFLRSDRLAGLVQWSAVIVSAVSIYGIARYLKASSSQALFSVLIWATFPQVILQSSSTQNDLITAGFLVSAVFFLLKAFSERKSQWLVLSSLAIGLGVGTKVTFLMVMVGFAVGIALIWLIKKDLRSTLFKWGAACIVSVLLLGSYTYIQNFLFFRSVVDDGSSTQFIAGIKTSKVDMVIGNSSLYLFQSADFSGFPSFIFSPINEIKGKIAEIILSPIRNRIINALEPASWSLKSALFFPLKIHEDLSWYGLLAFILLFPLILVQSWQAIRLKESYLFLSILSFWGFSLILILFLNWTPYRTRYFLPVITLCAPLLASIYPRAGSSRSIKIYGIAVLAIMILLNGVFQNQSKPLVGNNPVWNKDRAQIQTINRPGMLPVLQMVDTYVPADSRLAIKTGLEGWDYLFFGPDFKRTVIPLGPDTMQLNVKDLQQKNIDYVLVEPHQRSFITLPEGLYWVDQTSGWMLFTLHVDRARTEYLDPVLISGASDNRNLLTIHQTLVGKVGVIELLPGAWEIEEYQNASLLWLGDDIGYGLKIYLWSEIDQPVRFQMEVVPGPAKTDPTRTIRLYHAREKTLSYEDKTISGPGQLVFDVDLKKGNNRLTLAVQDHVEHHVQPNGDLRPLLLLLKHINVLP